MYFTQNIILKYGMRGHFRYTRLGHDGRIRLSSHLRRHRRILTPAPAPALSPPSRTRRRRRSVFPSRASSLPLRRVPHDSPSLTCLARHRCRHSDVTNTRTPSDEPCGAAQVSDLPLPSSRYEKVGRGKVIRLSPFSSLCLFSSYELCYVGDKS